MIIFDDIKYVPMGVILSLQSAPIIPRSLFFKIAIVTFDRIK